MIVDPATIPAVGDTLSCGHILTDAMRHQYGTHSTGVPIVSGYARTRDGRTFCYPCAVASERQAFTDAGTAGEPFVAYVDALGNLTTWTGGLLAHAMPYTHGVSRSGWHGSEIHAWRFRAPNGREWYGRNAGEGMCITVRPAKSVTR